MQLKKLLQRITVRTNYNLTVVQQAGRKICNQQDDIYNSQFKTKLKKPFILVLHQNYKGLYNNASEF